MKKYKVWFEQVNQSVYEVEAPSRDEAIREAGRLWGHQNFPPTVGDIEEQGSQDDDLTTKSEQERGQR